MARFANRPRSVITVETELESPAQRELVETAVRNALKERGGSWHVRVSPSDEAPHWDFVITGAAEVRFTFIWPGSAEDEKGRIEQVVKQNVGRALGEDVTAFER